MRIDRKCPTEPGTRNRGVAEATLDHAAVEELEGVLGPEPQRELRVAERLVAAAVPLERPGEDVVSVDRGPGALGATRERERARRRDVVVGVEERDLQIGSDSVRAQEPVDHADQRIGTLRRRPSAGCALEIAE